MPRYQHSAAVVAFALLATGCQIAPQGRCGESVTHDVVNYFQREWPLDGQPVAPGGACGAPVACGCSGHDCASRQWSDDWDCAAGAAIAPVHHESKAPAVPLDPGPPSRFFPVPVRPAFTPQEPTPVGLGTIPRSDDLRV